MHSTDTIDYAIVVSGEIWMELDDGAEVHLKQGDVVIHNGTKHAWRARSPEPCVMAFCMILIERRCQTPVYQSLRPALYSQS